MLTTSRVEYPGNPPICCKCSRKLMWVGYLIDSEYDEKTDKEVTILIEQWDCDHCGQVFFEDDVCYPDKDDSE
jgi:hypothetical protein